MRLLNSFLVFLLLATANTAHSQSEQEVILTTEKGSVYGTLLVPDTMLPVPVALIISGSGPTDRDGNNATMKNDGLKMLARALAIDGIASLRFDKRGIGMSTDSTLSEGDMLFDYYVDDAKAWIDMLAADIRFSDIAIIGHSEGSLVGMIAASIPEVDFFISIAGAGRPAREIIQEQILAQAYFMHNALIPILDSLESGAKVDSIPAPLAAMFRPSVQPYLISWFRHNPQHIIAGLNKPILLIQGTTDIQVPVSDAELLKKSAPKAQLEIFTGMNHVLKQAPENRSENIKTYNNPELPLFPGVVDAISGFIKKHS